MVEKSFILAAAVFGLSACGPANTSSLKSDPDNDIIINHVEQVATPAAVHDKLQALSAAAKESYKDHESIGTTVITIDQIINLGKEVWQIIEAGKPVANISFDYANALPRGVTGPEDLDGFSDLQSTSYRFYGTNLYGVTVYDVTYTLVHQYGGNYNSQGKYLSTVAVVPSDVSVVWGYTLDLQTTKVSAVNSGTKTDPIASLVLQMKFKVGTVIKKLETNSVFQFRGDSANVRMIQ